MTDIAQFLAARLDEDEERAELAQSVIAGSWDGWGVIAPQLHACCDTVPNIDRAGQHLYVNADPARVLAEVAAKWAIIAMHELCEQKNSADMVRRGAPEYYRYCECQSEDGLIQGAWPCDTLKHLAAVYADHPDYAPAWRVE